MTSLKRAILKNFKQLLGYSLYLYTKEFLKMQTSFCHALKHKKKFSLLAL